LEAVLDCDGALVGSFLAALLLLLLFVFALLAVLGVLGLLAGVLAAALVFAVEVLALLALVAVLFLFALLLLLLAGAGALVAALAGWDVGADGFSLSASALGAALELDAGLGALAGAGSLLAGVDLWSSLSDNGKADAPGTMNTLCRTSPPASRPAATLRTPPRTPHISEDLRVGHPLVIV
jgi:hypothetical protein